MAIELKLEGAIAPNKFLTNKKIMKKLTDAHTALHSFDRSNGTGWVELPITTEDAYINGIESIASTIRSRDSLFIVVGSTKVSSLIQFAALSVKSGAVEIQYVGESFDGGQLEALLEKIDNKNVSLCLITKDSEEKSVLTNFAVLENAVKKKYKKDGEYKSHIFVVTDYENGVAREVATKEKYKSLIFPRNLEVEFGLLVPSTLLPLAVLGVDLDSLFSGAKIAHEEYFNLDVDGNLAYRFALELYYSVLKGNLTTLTLPSLNPETKVIYNHIKELFDLEISMVDILRNSSVTMRNLGTKALLKLDYKKPQKDFIVDLPKTSRFAHLVGVDFKEEKGKHETKLTEEFSHSKRPVLSLSLDALSAETLGSLGYFLELSAFTFNTLISK